MSHTLQLLDGILPFVAHITKIILHLNMNKMELRISGQLVDGGDTSLSSDPGFADGRLFRIRGRHPWTRY